MNNTNVPPISFEIFKKTIDDMRLFWNVDVNVNSALEPLGDDFMNFSLMRAMEPTTRLLENIFKDEENGWISYWMWECNFGADGENKVEYDGKSVPFKTILDLWTVLMDNFGADKTDILSKKN